MAELRLIAQHSLNDLLRPVKGHSTSLQNYSAVSEDRKVTDIRKGIGDHYWYGES